GLGPSLVDRPLSRFFVVVEPVWLQGRLSVAVLRYRANIGQIADVWMGIVGFILLRWGLIERVTDLLVRFIWSTLYAMPINDQILRGFIIRAALKYRVSLPQLDALERRVIEQFSKDWRGWKFEISAYHSVYFMEETTLYFVR